MKIRIKGNSLRYRLTKSEVEKLWREDHLEENTAFPGKSLQYAIYSTDDSILSADFTGDKIVLSMPKAMIDTLQLSDKVGFEQTTGPVYLLVEKDFVCIDKVDEDQSDNYPNPHLNC